jgi:hypothetical protein
MTVETRDGFWFVIENSQIIAGPFELQLRSVALGRPA